METIIAGVLQNARVQLLIFLFLVLVFAMPMYMSYRVEVAINNLASRLECGQKIHVSDRATIKTTTEVARMGGSDGFQ